MLTFGILVTFCLLGASSVVNAQGFQIAVTCFEEMNKENNITHLLLDVRTPPQINYFCRRMSEWMKCIADNEHYLTTSQNTAYLKLTSGIHQFYLNVCPPGTQITEKYKANAPCFDLIRTQIAACDDRLSPLSSRDDSDVRNFREKCCSITSYTECVSSAVQTRCGNEAANISRDMVQRFHKAFDNDCRNVQSHDCLTIRDHHHTEHTRRYSRRYGNKPTTTKSYEDELWKDDSGSNGRDRKWDTEWKKHKSNGAERAFLPLIEMLFCLYATLNLTRFCRLM